MAGAQGEGDAYLSFWPSHHLPGCPALWLEDFCLFLAIQSCLAPEERRTGGLISHWADPFSRQLFVSLSLEAGGCLQAALPNQDQGLARAPDGPASCATPSGWLNGERRAEMGQSLRL